MSKPTAFSLFQLVWHFLKRFSIFFISGLAFSVHLDLATLATVWWVSSLGGNTCERALQKDKLMIDL